MDGYTVLAGVLIFFLLFIYATWFGVSIKIESQKEEDLDIKINPYDNLPLHRKLIDKKNKQVGFFDLGNHILIVGFVLLVILISINVE
jgi:TRAP-type C4-dicarboxylate transport system permease small subunit